MQKRGMVIVLGLFATLTISFANEFDISYQPKDKIIFKKYCEYIRPFASNTMQNLMVKSAQFFLDAPYKGGTLEFTPEKLVINLHEFDCVTLVESCFALSLMVKNGMLTWQQYEKYLMQIRYRNRKITDYTSRLHYSTDWLYDNAQKQLIIDMSKKIGGEPLILDLNYMSYHPNNYQALKETPSFINIIENIEKNIATRTHYYIPKEKFETFSNLIETGDIIFFTTNMKGLDSIHVGIAYHKNNVLTFINASRKYKKVMIEESTMLEYLKKQKRVTGIIIARPL